MKLFRSPNEINRQEWLGEVLGGLRAGTRILDAGAGQLQNRKYCSHLDYVSQDFCEYEGGGAHKHEGFQTEGWDTSSINLVSDITAIPASDESFDTILCSEVLEHVPEPTHALDEFQRLLKPNGLLILTAPFSSNVHMAPYHFCTGFSKYWYQHHLSVRGFEIEALQANGDWYAVLCQEILRLGAMERRANSWWWPLAYSYSLLGFAYFGLRPKKVVDDIACFGWHCIARKKMAAEQKDGVTTRFVDAKKTIAEKPSSRYPTRGRFGRAE